MNRVSLWIPGKPATKGSTRSFKDKKGNVRTVAANPKLQMFEAMIREKSSAEWGNRLPSDKPFNLELEYHAVRPKSHYKSRVDATCTVLKDNAPAHMTKKPDLSKVIRAVEDGMNKIVYLDDQQIRKIVATKQYSTVEGVRITVTEV